MGAVGLYILDVSVVEMVQYGRVVCEVSGSKWYRVTEDVLVCVYRRPTAVQDRPVDSDEDDFRDRDYDISTMANNINREVYRYGMFDNDDAEEVRGGSVSGRWRAEVHFLHDMLGANVALTYWRKCLWSTNPFADVFSVLCLNWGLQRAGSRGNGEG